MAGETDAERLADRLHARSQAKRPAVVAALHGARLQPHQRVLLRQHLALIGSVEASVAAIEAEIAAALESFSRRRRPPGDHSRDQPDGGGRLQSAWAAVRVPNSYSRALYHRRARRSGKKPAIVAVAAALATAIYHMLRTDQPYRDLGAQHLSDTDRRRKAQRLAAQLKHLGYEVSLHEAA